MAEIKDLIEITATEDESEQAEVTSEAADEMDDLAKQIDELEIAAMLSGPYDSNDAILTINAGAGGTDAQDWAQMLLRMYSRWLEQHNYKLQLVDSSPGEEAGLKGATIMVEGPFAYGYLKAERGIHRLVRLSPFNSKAKRQTSFASVEVIPQLGDETKVEIKTEDLRIDTFRAGGPGGQNVNKTSSAVRITHIPTGIVTQCQNERSQGQNKQVALKILQAKLFELQEKTKSAKIAKIRGNLTDIAWGNQIRSYVFHPYQMVKDHRTGQETGDINSVMDGDLDEFIEAFLKGKKNPKTDKGGGDETEV